MARYTNEMRERAVRMVAVDTSEEGAAEQRLGVLEGLHAPSTKCPFRRRGSGSPRNPKLDNRIRAVLREVLTVAPGYSPIKVAVSPEAVLNCGNVPRAVRQESRVHASLASDDKVPRVGDRTLLTQVPKP